MKRWYLGFALILAVTMVVGGCAKKSTEQASLTDDNIGFEGTNTEELAQLPQSGSLGTASQQLGVEVLPIETSPVTQLTPLPTQTLTVSSSASLAGQSRAQQIQQALKNAGLYAGKIDGKIGPASKRAIIAFQQNNGLKTDGKVGPKTWAALEPYLAGNAVPHLSATGVEE